MRGKQIQRRQECEGAVKRLERWEEEEEDEEEQETEDNDKKIRPETYKK